MLFDAIAFGFIVCLSVRVTHNGSVVIQFLPLISLVSLSSYNLFITFA